MRDTTGALASVRVCMLTHHFIERFIRRVGTELNLEMVNCLLADSKRIIKQRTLYKFINGEFVPYQLLGGFWNHTAGIIMLIDEHESKAVTVYTPDDPYPEHPRIPRLARYKKQIARKWRKP